jgi:8-oxo-dGTP pyrophosphatase MutT (NUDIX family)
MKYEWSGVLLITPDNEVIAMHRDDIPTIRDPGCFGIFGGAAEGDEMPIEAAMREIEEETNLKPKPEDFEFFKLYIQERDNLPKPAKLSVFVLRNIDPNTLVTHEGQGIKILTDANDPKIAQDVKVAFEDWFSTN